jgi:hypothetical protein
MIQSQHFLTSCALVASFLSLACKGAAQAPDSGRVRRAVIGAVKSRHAEWARTVGSYNPFIADSVRVVPDTSATLPGVVYYWGYFRPPHTADIVLSSVVYSAGGEVVRLVSPHDWSRMMNAIHWTPSSDSLAIVACGEMVRTAGPRADQFNVAIYRDTVAFSGHWPLLVRAGDISARAQPPTASEDAEGYHVVLWAVEPWRTTKYECVFATATGSATLSARDSIEGAGYGTGP